MLKDRFANLDELNYLARRMESFDYHEYDQFLIGITKLENPTEKDLINLTFNLDHFTLCKDVSSYGKIGREYVMNTEGAVPAHDEDDPKYAAIGKALIDRGLAQITAKGLLIYNPFDELTEVYDGQTFPEYYYENTLASAEVSYNGRTELLLLPGEELAIQKALAQLGAPSDSDCEIRFCLSKGEDDAWEERIEGIIRSEGLYEANKMLRFLDTGDMDWGKLTAAVELTDAKSAANIGAVAEHLGEFAYFPLTVSVYEYNEYGDLDYDSDCELDGKFADDYADEIKAMFDTYTASDDTDMAEYFDGSNSAVAKIKSLKWDFESFDGVLFGRVRATLTEPLTEDEEAELKEFITGQNSDGLGEGAEQQDIRISDGIMNVHFWNSGDSYFVRNSDEFSEMPDTHGMTMGGM